MNLKPLYDDLVEKNKELKAVADQISELLQAGDKEAALALKPQLDAAKQAVKEADEFYMSFADASQIFATGSAREYVPASKESGEKANVVDRAGFDAMDANERIKFLAAGGKINE